LQSQSGQIISSAANTIIGYFAWIIFKGYVFFK